MEDEEDVLLNKLSRICHEHGDNDASKLFSSFSKSLDIPICKHCLAPIFNSRVRIRKKFILSLYCSSCFLVSLLKLKKTIKKKKKKQQNLLLQQQQQQQPSQTPNKRLKVVVEEKEKLNSDNKNKKKPEEEVPVWRV